MPTLPQLETALINADKAGDVDAARTLAAAIVQARGMASRTAGIPGSEEVSYQIGSPPPEPSIVDKAIGAGEAGLSLLSGATTGTLGMIGGTLKGLADEILSGQFGTKQAANAVEAQAAKGAQAGTYAPRTVAGREMVQSAGEIAQNVPPFIPVANQIAGAAQVAAPAARASVAPAIKAAGEQVRSAVKQAVPEKSMPGVGAAKTDIDTLRQSKAENLPVPVKMTEGAITRNAEQLAFEKEAMKSPSMGAPLRARAEENNLQALRNFDTLIDQSGSESPDLAATGTKLSQALATGYKAAKNKTRAAYKKAEEAGELEAPIPTKAVVDVLNESASAESTAPVLVAARKELQRLGGAFEGGGQLMPNPEGMTLKNMEQLRQFINSTTGFEGPNLKFGGDLKRAIDSSTEGQGGALYKNARAERQNQARKYENRAIVAQLINNKRGSDDPRVPVDEVFRKTVLNGSPEELTFLKRVLKTNGKAGQEAWKELEGETLKYIKSEASKGMGMDSADNPIISPAKLHQVVSQLDANGRLDLMIGKKNAQIVRDLNEVVRYVNTVPPGTLVNTSGTAGILMTAMAEAGIFGSLTGLPVPVMSGLKLAARGMKDAKTKARIKQALGE